MRIRETVAELAAEVLSRDALDMTASFALTRENRVAPIDVAALAIACERAFHIAFHDELVAQWRTLVDVLTDIQRLLDDGMAEPVARSDEERTGWYYE